MSSLWPKVFLGEVLAERSEIPSQDAIEKGEIPIVAKIMFNNGSLQFRSGSHTRTDLILIRPGDLVVSGINAAKGAIAIYGEENHKPIAATIHYSAYIPEKNMVDISYLWRYLRSRLFRDLLVEHMPGGIKTELNSRRLLSIPIHLPPLEEQHRIVARIEELAARIEEARGLRRAAMEEAEKIESLATRAILMKLDNASDKPLRQLVTLQGGGTPSKSNPFFWEGKIPWISPKDMKNREINDAIDHISEEATQESSAKLIEPGAVLIVVRGMILAHTVPSAVLRVPASINQDMKALVTDERLLPQYLCVVLWGLNHKLLKLVEKSTHDTRKLETSKLLDFTIPIPSLSEQNRIVAYLDELRSKVDSLKQLQTETSIELDALLPSILDKAFKGEL